jgi:protein MAK16
MPSKLWERIKLSQNYSTALKQIDDRLIYWPKFLTHKCKQRLTRLTQVAIRMRRIAKEEARLGEKLVPKLAPKIRRREDTRERKAEAAAKLERTIERELIQRLREGAYGDQPLNVSESIWKKVLNALEREGEGTRDRDLDKGIEEDEDEEEEPEYEREEEDELEDGAVEYVSDFDESEDDLGDIEDWLGSDDESADKEESESEDSDDGPTRKKLSVAGGNKRKRGQVVRMKPKKTAKRGREIEEENEFEAARDSLAF